MTGPQYVTFDCYDTLVEFPIDRVTRAILRERVEAIDVARFLADFETLRYQTTTYGPYHELPDLAGLPALLGLPEGTTSRPD
jgi:2-haloacid dehalogenase